MIIKLCVIACLLLNFGNADGIVLDISPNMTSSLFTANPTLSCSPDGLLASSILYMKISKVEENGNLPLATVSANNYLIYDNGTKDHEIRASGLINVTALEKSYLKVTLMNPTRDQSGSYRCSVMYMNTDGSVKTDLDTADFVIKEYNMAEFKGIIQSLKEEVDTIKGQLLESRCPDKTWTKAEEMCYKVIDGKSNKGMEHPAAFQACNDLHGSLVIIHDANTMNRIKTSVTKGQRDTFWIGLENEANTYNQRNNFVWDDNTQLGYYAPWAANHPLASQFKSYCVTLDTHDSNKYTFVDVPCRKEQYRSKAICQVPAKKCKCPSWD